MIHRNPILATMAMMIAAIPALAVGTVNQAISPIGRDPGTGPDNRIYQVAINWTADAANGTVPATLLNIGGFPAMQGMRLVSLEIKPGSPAPTNNYTVTLTDSAGVDVALGAANSLSSSASAALSVSTLAAPLFGSLTFNLTNNSVNSATGTVLAFFAPLSQGTTTLGGPGLSTNNAFTGTNTFSGATTVKNLNLVRYADQYAGADCGAKINAAIADGGTNTTVIVNTNCGTTISTALVLQVGTQLEFTAGAWTWSTGVQTISTPNVTIEGVSPVSTQFNLASATGDLWDVTANGFNLNNVYVTAAVGIPRTAGCVLGVQGGGFGLVHDVLLQDVYCGIKASVVNSNLWRIQRLSAQTAGGNWNAVIQIGPIASGTMTQWQINDVMAGLKTSTTSAASIILDSGADGIEITNFVGGPGYLNVAPANTFPALLIQNTGASNAPRWVRLVNFMPESGFSAEDCTITAGTDISIINSYFASSLRGCDISGGTGIHIERSVFLNHQNQGILLQGGTDVSIVDSAFSDNSLNANGGTAHIFVAANVNDFKILGNRFGNNLIGNANQANFGVTVAAGTSNNYQIAVNRFDTTQLTGGAISDGGTGLTKYIFNVPTTTADRINIGGALVPTAAGGSDLGSTSLPFGNLWLGTAATNNFKFAPAATAAARTITVPDPLANDTLAFLAATQTLTNKTLSNSVISSSLNNMTTQGQTVSVIPCVTSQKTESAADTNLLTCAILAQTGSYRVRFVLSLSAANTATLGWTATWTDSNGAAQAPTNLALINDTIAGANGSATPALTFTTSSVSDYHGDIDIDVNNAGTSIVVKLTFSGTSFTGKASATVERII